MRVFFEVYEINGEYKGRLLKAEPILALAKATVANVDAMANSCTLLLCAAVKIISTYFWNIEKKITAPFSTLDFLTSIKPRAPTL